MALVVNNQCRRHGRLGFDPWSERSPGEGNGNQRQYSCLENPMDRRAWWATFHRVGKSWTRLKQLSMHHAYLMGFHISSLPSSNLPFLIATKLFLCSTAQALVQLLPPTLHGLLDWLGSGHPLIWHQPTSPTEFSTYCFHPHSLSQAGREYSRIVCLSPAYSV